MRVSKLVFGVLLTAELVVSYNSPPRLPTKRWVALGDSFSAGPGSGFPAPQDEGQCFRRMGAYPPLLHAEISRYAFREPDFIFESCTGSTIPDVIETQVPSIFPNTSFATLSVGGNDLLFYNILISCIFNFYGRWGDCDRAIANSTETLYNAATWNNWHNMTMSISDRLQYTTRGGRITSLRNTALYQTGYPPFFETWTGQCNDARFLPPIFPYAGPFMTIETRDRLNLLGQELNAIREFCQLHEIANPDERYNGHRFCREGVIKPDRNNNETWFFNMFSSGDSGSNSSKAVPLVGQQQPDSRMGTAFMNRGPLPEVYNVEDLSRVVPKASNATNYNETSWPSDTEFIQKTFHPRSSGHRAASEELQQRLRYDVNSTSAINAEHLRIMCVGDSLAVGIGQDGHDNSYRLALHSLLAHSNSHIDFVGTQLRGSPPSNRIEGYIAALISGLHSRLRNTNAIAQLQPNVVILTAGTADLRGLDAKDYAGLNSTRNDLESLIGYIFEECNNCVVLVGDIPPTGSFTWPPSQRQRQVVQFNAMISEVVNKQQALHKRHVLKVHFTPAGGDSYSDNGYPTNNGYFKMAYDIHERLWDADTLGWILEPADISGLGDLALYHELVEGVAAADAQLLL